MNIVMKLTVASSLLMTLATPALAGVNINSPANKAEVESPFKLSATAETCSSKEVAVMGYSIDSSGDSTFFEGTSIEDSVALSAGAHTVHVKSWTEDGTVCVTDVAVSVAKAAIESEAVPANAIVNSNLQSLAHWSANHDTGGKGGASGTTALVATPSKVGITRKFSTTFEKNGDERYAISFGDDANATNFFYDTWIYLTSTSSKISNIEMDMNQVMSNGKTVIYGFQCDGWSSKWDYAGNTHGTAHPGTGWISTGKSCNPRTWKVNAWHHVQVSYSRNATGDVTYHYVTFDGVTQTINKTVLSAYALGWGHATLLTNFQVDGYGTSGSNTVYVDAMTISRW